MRTRILLVVFGLYSPAIAGTVGGGFEWADITGSFSTSNGVDQASFNVGLTSSVHLVERADVWLIQDWQPRDDGLIGFSVGFSISGTFGANVSPNSYSWSLVFPSEDQPIVNLIAGLSWYSYEEDDQIIESNRGYVRGSLVGAMWDGTALTNFYQWVSDYDHQRRFNWLGSIPGHFLTEEIGEAVFGTAPEPATMVLFCLGVLFLSKKRKVI